jgi:hypothetical protein
MYRSVIAVNKEAALKKFEKTYLNKELDQKPKIKLLTSLA